MDIKILKNKDYQNGSLLNQNLLLETAESESRYDNIKKLVYNIYDFEKNIRYEILPRIEKHKLGEIINVSVASDFVYFFNVYEKENEEKQSISIIRYNYKTAKMECILTLEDDIEEYIRFKRLKVFVLNDLYLLVQQEYLRANLSESYAGFFDFEIDLYNIKDGQKYPVVDENLVNNGIDNMISISENLCVAKTGFSVLPDNRYNELTEDEASLEKISFVNISQLVSDMLIHKTDIVIDTFEQAFYKNTIPYIKKEGNFIIYSKVNIDKKEEEVTFYNYITKETKNCINKNVIRCSELANPCVIAEEPFIYIKREYTIDFLNLNTSKVTISFQDKLSFMGICNNTFIFKGVCQKGLWKKNKICFEIWRTFWWFPRTWQSGTSVPRPVGRRWYRDACPPWRGRSRPSGR